MGDSPKIPTYMKYDRELYESIERLPPAQAAKLHRFVMMYFFDGIEADPEKMPERVRDKYSDLFKALKEWRKNVLNGSKNKGGSSSENREGFHGTYSNLAGDSSNLGTHPNKNPNNELGSARGATNNESSKGERNGGVSNPTPPCATPSEPPCVGAAVEPPTRGEVEEVFSSMLNEPAQAEPFYEYGEANGWAIPRISDGLLLAAMAWNSARLARLRGGE